MGDCYKKGRTMLHSWQLLECVNQCRMKVRDFNILAQAKLRAYTKFLKNPLDYFNCSGARRRVYWSSNRA